jgi:hypothetical protein
LKSYKSGPDTEPPPTGYPGGFAQLHCLGFFTSVSHFKSRDLNCIDGVKHKEAAMTQSMIGFVIGLAVMIGAAGMLGRRYRRDHPENPDGAVRMREWLDTHHMSWLHQKH